MLGLGGGGVLALSRRVRALLWAGVGLAFYPRVKQPRETVVSGLGRTESKP